MKTFLRSVGSTFLLLTSLSSLGQTPSLVKIINSETIPLVNTSSYTFGPGYLEPVRGIFYLSSHPDQRYDLMSSNQDPATGTWGQWYKPQSTNEKASWAYYGSHSNGSYFYVRENSWGSVNYYSHDSNGRIKLNGTSSSVSFQGITGKTNQPFSTSSVRLSQDGNSVHYTCTDLSGNNLVRIIYRNGTSYGSHNLNTGFGSVTPSDIIAFSPDSGGVLYYSGNKIMMTPYNKTGAFGSVTLVPSVSNVPVDLRGIASSDNSFYIVYSLSGQNGGYDLKIVKISSGVAIPQTVAYHSTNPFGNFQLSVDSQGHLHVLFHELNEFKYTRLIESTTRFYSPKTIVTGYFPFFAQDKSPYFYAAIQSDQSFKLTYLTPSEIKLVSFIPVFDLVVDQKLADGISSFGEVAQVLDGDVLDWETAPHTFLVKKGINGRFQSSSSLAASNTQKYYEWTNRKAWHNRLEFQPTDNEQIESQFKQIDGSGLLSAISDGMVMNNLSGISLSDPWFEKNGLSKGTQAILEPVSIPFDLSINGPRKGVFLNQVKPNPGEIRPYYSIRSENVVQWSGHEFAFQSWTTVGAQLTETQSGEQPIVFTAPNATVTATYKAMMSSRLPNWVQNQAQYSGNGKSAVVYKSETNGFGGVWLHTEKNGQKYETGDYSTDYELGSPLSVASTDYNHLKQYFAMFNVVSTVPGDYLLDIVEVTNGVITQSRRMANIPALPANLSPSTKVYISGHNPINSSEWGANPANLLILLVDGLTVYSSSLSFNNGLFNTSSPWTSFTVSSPPVFSTNGKYAYLSWLSNGNIVGRQYKTSWQSPVTLFSNSGGNYTSFAATVNPTDDLVLMMIRNQQTSNNKQACYGKRYYSGSSSPVTVLESGMPYGNYTAWSVSVEGNKTLASIGKSPDGESWNYYLWKNDGTSWTKETSPFSAAPARLLHNEVDEYPVEATIQPDGVTNLYALKTNPVSWPTGGAGMAKDGDEADGFSIVASRLGDTTETWITIDPASIDSIVIDSLKVWSIALKQESVRDYLISQLNRVGSASYTDSSATIRFVPSEARYTFYVVDPSGNKFRIRKSSLDAEEEEEPVLSATVSVFPNPFNPVTVLSVTMPEAGHARLTIYNILGQQVASLVNGQLNAGVHDLRFNASNLSSGTYLYRFEAGKVVKTGKLQLMK